jgi:thymidylate kinase
MLVAIEGIDGAGKTHTSKLLFERLGARGLPVHLLEKDSVKFGDPFSDNRLDSLRAVIWPNEPEPASDPFGTHFYLFLLAAWFSSLKPLASILSKQYDFLIMDRSYFRVIAKAHTRSGLDIPWLLSLFGEALTPDFVVLLDIDPALAWRRRTSFKATELGRWDGFLVEAEQAFCNYQNAIRQILLQIAEKRDWLVIRQTSSTTPLQVVDRIEQALSSRLTL